MIQRSTFLRGLCAGIALLASAGAVQADLLDDARAAKKIRIATPTLVKVIVDKAPATNLETKFVMQSFPLGIGMRKGEAKLQTWINQWVAKNLENGKLGDIYTRFHG